ncbi:D-alanyl-D-alanine carboxypeptidase, partial [Alphaproteobacteria bacterium]|nr:D-alanyl-D-alanine carboxypeptidase [Alphaproteobacteria bacterium]
YIAFSRVAERSLSLEDRFLVSEKAWKMGGSRSFLDVGSSVTLDELLHGIIIQSGNDAAVVLAEGISGTEENFVAEMNIMAQKLGMSNTVFANATGWPHPDLTTTAYDLNLLATALIKDFPAEIYPQLYPIFSQKKYTLNNIKQDNRNPLLYGKNASNNGVDGLKTGYTEESGYGLVASALRGSQRVVLVLNGMESKKERAFESRRLVDFIFREFKLYNFFAANEVVVHANVWLGTRPNVALVVEKPLQRVLSRVQRAKTKISTSWLEPVPAPISKGQVVGHLNVKIDGKLEERIQLVAESDIDQLGAIDKLFKAVKHLVFGTLAEPVKE